MQKKSIICGTIAVGLIIAGIAFAFNKTVQGEILTVTRQDIIETVEVSGEIKPSQDIQLAFEQPGKVDKIYVSIGDTVRTGQPMIALVNKEAKSQLAQAKAAIESAQAGQRQYEALLENQQEKLAEMKQGARKEDVAITATKLENAKTTIENAKTNLATTQLKSAKDLEKMYQESINGLRDSFAKTDSAINTQLDDLFTNDDELFPKLSFQLSDSALQYQIENARSSITDDIQDTQKTINAIVLSQPEYIEQSLQKTADHEESILKFLNMTGEAINASLGLPASIIASYKTNINIARANITVAFSTLTSLSQTIALQKIINQSNVQTAQSSLNEAKNNANLIQKELELKNSGSSKEQFQAQQSIIKQAQANVESAQASVSQARAHFLNNQALLEKTIINSPINGLVVKIDVDPGEIISPNIPILSIISQSNYQIEAQIPETEISKISISDIASVTLDAYSAESPLSAKIVSIDPVETKIEGVSRYRAILDFTTYDTRIKSGMSVDISIATETKNQILALPSYAITFKNGQSFVNTIPVSIKKGKLNKKQIIETPVKTGLMSNNGMIELTSGLTQGARVLVIKK